MTNTDSRPVHEDAEQFTNSRLLKLDEELIEYYLEHIPVNLADLKRAHTTKNITEIKFQAHKLIPAMVIINNHETAESLKQLSNDDINNSLVSLMVGNVIKEIEMALLEIQK